MGSNKKPRNKGVKMPLYLYACDKCNHEYQEGRLESEPQWFTKCPVAGCNGDLIEKE